jgi:hypothetical protein
MVEWPTVCKPKELGGLGILNTRLINLALIVSWKFGDSSHGDGLTEGLDGGEDGPGSGLCQRRHLGYPGLGPSTPEVKLLLPPAFY